LPAPSILFVSISRLPKEFAALSCVSRRLRLDPVVNLSRRKLLGVTARHGRRHTLADPGSLVVPWVRPARCRLDAYSRRVESEAAVLSRRLTDLWFEPKPFETEAIYERLGVLVLKRYVPTGGDLFMRWIRRRHPDLKLLRSADIESLQQFERWTRVAESTHLAGFVCFGVLAVFRFVHGSLSRNTLAVAMSLDLALGLWPVALQRYNRLRLLRAIETAGRLHNPKIRP
jgi:Glycosyl-4,4'-diaponeurosporenoate acyltransferase